jgi:hypothetical protein
MRLSTVLGLSLALLGVKSLAQEPAPTATPSAEETKHSGAPLGQFGLGSFVVTPTFLIGNLIVDTNIQYERDRRTDFLASAGPGLDISVAFRDHWKIAVQGISQYFYFLRSVGLRQWTGGAVAGLHWATTGTRASLSTSAARDFSRPSFEVDTRVVSKQRNLHGTFERDLGRLTLVLSSSYQTIRPDSGQSFRGADLETALTSDQFSVGPQFRYRLTPISSLIVEGNYAITRFPRASRRNFHAEGAGIGIMTSGLLKGQATIGVRRNQLSNGNATQTQPYFRLSLTESRQIGRRFKLSGGYTHESTISAFAVDGSLPTIEQRGINLELGIEITKRLDLRLRGSQIKLKSDGLVTVILDDGSRGTARREDVAYIGGADLGVRLGRARLGMFGTYTGRQSLYFSDFGIEGLQAGARLEYSPR